MHTRDLTSYALLLGLLLPGLAQATNGYFAHGYGVKSQGMAGVGIALPQDGLAVATNPAGIAFVGNRADIGLSWFRPDRGAEIHGNGANLNGSYDGNGSRDFLIPEAGYVQQLNDRWTSSVALYANGGMNTNYRQNPWAAFGASGPAGVNLAQLFLSPAVAYKFDDRHALGLALNLAYQRFEAKGIQPFASSSAASGNFSNQGSDSSRGWGARIGYTGDLAPGLTLGLTYAGKTRMSKFDKYRGLFAEEGGFDIPANYGAGLAWQASEHLTLAADVQRIEYSGVKSVGNPIDVLFSGGTFGSANGAGFGWRDVTVYKLGASYAVSPALTVRAGISHASQPIASSQTFLNILAPGVVQNHASLGFTRQVDKHGELSGAYTHAFKQTVKGSNSIPASGFGGGEADLHMSEDIAGVAYGWKF